MANLEDPMFRIRAQQDQDAVNLDRRIQAAEDRLSRLLNPKGSGTPIGRFQIMDDTNASGALPWYYPAIQVELGGAEVEGGAGGYTSISAVRPIIVIGTQLPMMGDVLDAFLINGRWVAERGGESSTPPTDIVITGCGCPTVPASLNLAINYAEASGLGYDLPAATLVYGPRPSPQFDATGVPANIWWSTIPPPTLSPFPGTYYYLFYCAVGSYSLYYYNVFWEDNTGAFYSLPSGGTPPYTRFINVTVVGNWVPGFNGNACSPFTLVYGSNVTLTGHHDYYTITRL